MCIVLALGTYQRRGAEVLYKALSRHLLPIGITFIGHRRCHICVGLTCHQLCLSLKLWLHSAQLQLSCPQLLLLQRYYHMPTELTLQGISFQITIDILKLRQIRIPERKLLLVCNNDSLKKYDILVGALLYAMILK